MATSSTTEEAMNLEIYTLIWLDISRENTNIQQIFRTIINHFQLFEDINQCEKYIQSLNIHDRVFLVINNYYNRDFITHIHDLPQVYSIYIYCKNQKQNNQWIKQFSKVTFFLILLHGSNELVELYRTMSRNLQKKFFVQMKGITSDMNDLVARIHSDQKRTHEPISMNIFNTNIDNESSTSELNGQFLHYQLLIDVLLRLQSNPGDKNELISLCENEYKDNILELNILHEFEQNYSSKQAIQWYTRESFLYKILNKSLRTQNIDLLFLLRFFIHDIEKQLQLKQCSSSIRVYRSQLMSNNELDILKTSLGQLISINSFLSTSITRQNALSFLNNQSNNLQRILFEIDADPSLEDLKPFSNITKQSYFPEEEEILFMLGSIFRMVKIDYDNEKNIWMIRMILCSQNEHDVKSIFDYMKKQYGDNHTNLLSFGKVLWTMGKFNQAEKYFLSLLKQLPKNHEYISYCYRALGNVADDKGDYEASLKWHMKAIDLMTKTFDANDPLLGESYNSIGSAYDTKGEYKQALEFYKKAYFIWKDIYGEDHLNVAICLNNIGCVYVERQQYSKALQSYQKALTIRQKHLPTNHSDIGASHNNIGETYRRLGDCESALTHLKLSLEIYRLSLPSEHPDKAEVLMNIGIIYQNLNDNKQALDYYEKSSNIYHKAFKATHSSVRKIDQLIQQIHTS